MSTRKTTLVYAVLIAFAAGMVIASRLDLSPTSSAQTLVVPETNSAPITGALDAQTFRNVAKAQQPMVVNIRTELNARQNQTGIFGGPDAPPGGPDDFFRRFFGDPGSPQAQPPQGPQGPQGRNRRQPTMVAAGTGFIISKDGLILTNNHVVENAVKITVSLFGEDDDQDHPAKLIGRDAYSDIALIQLTDKPDHPLPVAKFGDSAQMAAGDWVMAIGNPFNNGWTVTVGVVSAMQRPFAVNEENTRQTEMIQTDAAINPGNSGGPLLNLRGEVIGINTAIISNGRSEGNIGIGFAVPINTARDLLPQLNTGKVVRGRIGVAINPIPRGDEADYGLKSHMGALVSSVIPDGAADKGGIVAGDVIIEFDGKPVSNYNELQKMVTATKPGRAVPVKVLRDKKERTLNVTVEELDLEAETQSGRQGRGGPQRPQQAPDVQGQDSFGITLSSVTPAIARRMQLPSGQLGALVTDVDPNGPSVGKLEEDDVILSVNGQRVSNAEEAGRELQRVPSSRNARILVWRPSVGRQVFVTVTKD
jgi:serine protease Do